MPSQCPELRPASAKLYAVAGRSLCVEALDDSSARVVGRYFRDWHLTPADDARPDARIRLRLGGTPPPIPPGLDSFPLYEGGRCHTDGHTYHLDVEGSRVLIHESGGAAVEVWLAAGADAAAHARAVFNAFSGAMRRCGLFELHSGCVVEPATGRGVLLAGASGSGKTTLTVQLASAGWGYLSDDVLLLSEEAGAVEARPLRRVFAATGATVAAAGLEGVGAAGRARDADSPPEAKFRFAPEEFFPGGFVESCRPEALCFPAVAHAPESRVVEVTRAEALARLIRMCPWACFDRRSAAAHLRVLSLLARGCRAFELHAGADVLADPARAAALLAAHAGR